MKAVVVVALLALCAFAFELPKSQHPKLTPLPKVRRDDPSGDIKWFTPKDLECAFHVDYKEYTNPESDYDMKGTIYVGGNHSCMSYKMEISGVEIKYKEIVRADIKDGDEICYIETASGKYEGKEVYMCDYQMFDPEYSIIMAEYMREALTMDWPYETVEKDQPYTKDMKCDVYESATYGIRFCVKDDRIAGFDSNPYRFTFDDYKNNAAKDDFSVSSKYEGCEAQKKIYEDATPVPADCELKDAAVAVKAVAAVVLAMMALFF